MPTAYWLAFALGAIPYFGYLVGLAFFGLSVSAFKKLQTSRPGRWLPIGATVAAFAIALWQGVTYDALFFDWTLRGRQHATVLGVEIPFAVGENAAGLAFVIFFGLVLVWTEITMILAVFRKGLGRVQRLISLGSLALFGWLGWLTFKEGLRYGHALF